MKNGGKNKSVAFIILFSIYIYIYIYKNFFCIIYVFIFSTLDRSVIFISNMCFTL